MKNTLIYMFLHNQEISFDRFKKLDVDFDYKELEKQNNLKFVTIFDREYPSQLTRLKNPPTVLATVGNLELLNNYGESLSVIGQGFEGDEKSLPKELLVNPHLDTLISGLHSTTIVTYLSSEGEYVHYPKASKIFVSDEPLPIGIKYLPESTPFLKDNLLITTAHPTAYFINNDLKNYTPREDMVVAMSSVLLASTPPQHSKEIFIAEDMGNEIFLLDNFVAPTQSLKQPPLLSAEDHFSTQQTNVEPSSIEMN